MQLSRTPRPARPSTVSVPVVFVCAGALLLLASAAIRSTNHDESQYVAAISLMRQGLPYRDFAYLQTPLQPLLFAPLSHLPAGTMLIAVRIVNATLGLATVALLLMGLRNRASRFATLVSLVGLLCTGPFLLASSLARNDALAMALLTATLPPLLSATEAGPTSMFGLAGLFFGLATSAKISAALPAAAAGLFILIQSRPDRGQAISRFGIGLLVGLLPTFVMAHIAPAEFRFDVFTYNFDAPLQWGTSIGQGAEFNPFLRVLKLTGFACLGPILVALLATILDRKRDDGRRLLDLVIVGGLIAAYLPVPALVQYMVPVLPPLFARFALALDAAPPARRRVLLMLSALSSIAGLSSNFVAHFGGLEPIRAVALGREVAQLAHGGPVVTLSGEYVAGSGILLDSRFAAGPFLYRTRGALAARAEADGRSVAYQSLEQALDSHPPSVILTGAETQRFPPVFPSGLDQPLIEWAERHRFHGQSLPNGFEAFVNPERRPAQ